MEKSEAIEDEFNYLLDVETAIEEKLERTAKRQKIVNKFIKSSEDNLSFTNWLDDNGYDSKDIIRGIGYYYGEVSDIIDGNDYEIAISNDGQNIAIDVPLTFSEKLGYYSPKQSLVKRTAQIQLIEDGYGYDKKNDFFYPKSEPAWEFNDDIIGGWRDIDILAMDNEEITDYLDALDVEQDYFSDKLDEVETVLEKLSEKFMGDSDYSNSIGDKFRNWNRKRKEKITLRKEARVQNKDERDVRKDARKQKRASKSDCKASFKSGALDRDEYSLCKRAAKAEKRRQLIEDGGGRFFTRSGRKFNKFNPFSAAARGGFLTILKMNIFGAATRIAPIYIDDPMYNQDYVVAIRQSKSKIDRIWKNLGGNQSKMVWAVKEGYKKTPRMTTQKARIMIQESTGNPVDSNYSNIEPLSDAMIGTLISAGTGVLQLIMGAISKSIKNKKALNPQRAPQSLQNIDFPTQQEIDQMLPEEYKGMRADANGNIYDANGNQIKSDTILGINKTVFYVSISVVALILILILLINKKK